MNVPAIAQPKPMLLAIMADKYSLREEEFAKTVRATCGLGTATAEQFAAFLIVAKTYDLNPLTKEIYAFPGKGGGIVPIVSVDGWLNLVNSNPHCDGFEFEMTHGDDGKLQACTCKMYRKDRKHAVTVTEYLEECKRPTDPWKMEHRMLRHKALIQAARYAFGFAGIYDEDEGRTIAEAVDITPKPPRVPSPSEVERQTVDHVDQGHGDDKYKPGDEVKLAGSVPPPDDPISSGPQNKYLLPAIGKDYDSWFTAVLLKIGDMPDGGELESFWNAEVEKYAGTDAILVSDMADLTDAYDKQQSKLNSDE